MERIVAVLERALEVTGAERAVVIVGDRWSHERWALDTSGNRDAAAAGDDDMPEGTVESVLAWKSATHRIDVRGPISRIMEVSFVDVLCVQLVLGRQVVGALYVDRRAHVGEFSDGDFASFRSIVGWAAAQVARHRLENPPDA